LQTGDKKIIGTGREVVGRRKDSSVFPMDLTLSDMNIGNEIKFTGIVRDITERKNAEARIKSIVETAVDGIIVMDSSGIVESFNPAAERLFTYSANEVIGQNIRMLMPTQEHDQYIKKFLQTGNKKIAGNGREVVGLRKDGTTFPLELAVSEMRIGNLTKFTGIVRDITERKQAYESVRQSKFIALQAEAANQVKIVSTQIIIKKGKK
jgi:two-component system sensor kinase FixL